jgi:hypothetical protein
MLQTDSQLKALEVPYGQSLARDITRYTFDDPRSIAATEVRYTPYLSFFGVKSLNIHQEIPRQQEQIKLGEFLWEFGLMDREKVYQAPEWVCDRMAHDMRNEFAKAFLPALRGTR